MVIRPYFIMSRVTFAWSRDVMIKTMSPHLTPCPPLLPRITGDPAQKDWGHGMRGLQAGRSGGCAPSSSENSPQCSGCGFPLNPIHALDWHLWDKRHCIPLEVISLASLLPGHAPRDPATFWWHPSSSQFWLNSLQQFLILQLSPRGRGGEGVGDPGKWWGGGCSVLFDQAPNVQPHN